MVTRDEVKTKLGIPMTDPSQDGEVDAAIASALSWLPTVKPTVDWTAPAPHQRDGVVWLATRLFQSLAGTDDRVADIDVGATVFLLGRQAQEILGLGYYNDPVVS